MKNTKCGYADGTFGQLHYRRTYPRERHKRPIFCLHQSPKSGQEFERLMSAAANHRDLIAPDYPGYGMSDPPALESDATIATYAREMWVLADALAMTKLDLIGHHTGSKVALEMATQRPEHVGKIVLISAAILTDEELTAFTEHFVPIELDLEGTRFTHMWRQMLDVRGPGQTLEMLANGLQMNLMGGERYEWGHAAAFAHGPEFVEALKTLEHAITIINPGDSLHEITKRAEPFLGKGAIINRPGWGYGFMDVWPEESAKLILSKL